MACTIRSVGSKLMAKDNAQHDSVSIEELGDGLRSDVASLKREVTSMSLDLGRLRKTQESLSLAYVIKLLRSALASMPEELQMVRGDRDSCYL